MKQTLGKIISVFEQMMDEMDSIDDPKDPRYLELAEKIEELKGGDLRDKVDSWIHHLEGLECLIDFVSDKLFMYKEKLARLTNAKQRLRGYLEYHMQTFGITSLEGAEGKILLAKNPVQSLKLNFDPLKYRPSCVLTSKDGLKISEDYPEFVTEEKVYVLDTQAVKKALESGRDLYFAKLEQGHHVRIK